MVSSRNLVIAIVGPTASGKSALAEALSSQLDGEIVSADSMQVYKGMDIGTAKTPPEKRGVAYHCIDLVTPDQAFSAATYQNAARAAFEDIWRREKQPILCGGTGLYVRAAVDDFALGEREDTPLVHRERSERRERLAHEAEELGPQAFHAKLTAVDPESAQLIHPHNVRRVVRAFEWLEEGSSYAEQVSGFDTYKEVFPTVHLGLDMPREQLYSRIDRRVEEMIEQGLLGEVQGLLEQGYEQALTAQQAIGYKELLGVLRQEESLEAAVAQIQQASRHYAKRQLSWFRRDKRLTWLDARKPLNELTSEARALVTT